MRDFFNPVEFVEELAPNTWQRDYLFKKGGLYKALSGKRVLDVGSGTGVFAKRFIKYAGHLDCLDIVKDNLDYIKSIFPGVGLILGDAESLPQIDDSCYDIVICTGVIEHFKHPEAAIKELVRILKPGGYIYINVSIYPQISGLLQKKIGTFLLKYVSKDDVDIHRQSKFSHKEFYFMWEINPLVQEMSIYETRLEQTVYSGGLIVNLIDYVLAVIEKFTRSPGKEYASLAEHNYRLNLLSIKFYAHFCLPFIRMVCFINNYLRLESTYCLLKFRKMF